MMNFYQFWDKLNGKPYEDGTPPPAPYNFGDYENMITNASQVNTADKSYGLTPLQPEDMARASADDVAAEYLRIHKGKNPLGLGKPMSDEDLKKFYGQGW